MKNNLTQKNIPNGWQFLELSAIADIIMGQSPNSSSYNQVGDGLPFFQGKADFTDSYKTVVRQWTSEPTKISEPADALISVRAPVGDIAVNNVKACIGRGLAVVRAKKGISYQTYLFYKLQSLKGFFNTKAQGSTFTAINGPELRKISILLPPIKEQQKIAEILGMVDKDIAKTQQVIEVTEKLKRGLMQQLFARGLEDKTPHIVQLGKVARVQGGYSFRSFDFSDDGIGVIRISNIKNGYINLDDIKFYSKEITKRLSAFSLKEDDVVIAMSGATTGKVGTVKESDLPLLMNQRVGRFVLSPGIYKKYLYNIVISEFYQKRVWDFAIGGAQPNVSGPQLESIEIPLFEMSIQKKIADMLSVFDEKILINKKLKEKLTLLKKGLMQDLLAGKIRTNNF